MRTTLYLILTRGGSVEARKKHPSPSSLRTGQRAVQLTVDVDDALFEQPIPRATLRIGAEHMIQPQLTVEPLRREPDLGPIDAGTCANMLSLASIYVTPQNLAGVPQADLEALAEYAGAIHLHASDNPDVVIPPKPAILSTLPICQDEDEWVRAARAWNDMDDLEEEEEALEEEEDEGCPKGDPSCTSASDDCHDACETPEEIAAATAAARTEGTDG